MEWLDSIRDVEWFIGAILVACIVVLANYFGRSDDD